MVKNKRKIAVVTGTRAEYGLLYWLIHEIANDPDLELQLIVTGMHMSPEFGLTYKLIEQDNLKIAAKVEMLMSSDSAVGIGKSVGLGVISFTDTFDTLAPDIVVLLGDRFEALAVAQAALIQKIPVAHIHGGELSEGAIDDAIRHSITKMSQLHFVAADVYRKRVIQLGETPDNVYNVGAPGLERISRMSLLDKNAWQEKIGFTFGETNFLVTYHPATMDINESMLTIQNLLNALDHFPQAKIIFTKANADEAGRAINKKIDEYVLKNQHRAAAFVTLGDFNYLSLLQHIDAVIGNSSSGLIEVPHFRKPTINIGDRQNNRLKAASVIDCDGEYVSITSAITKSLSHDFKKILQDVDSPYTKDQTATKIASVLKQADLKKILVKRFNDL